MMGLQFSTLPGYGGHSPSGAALPSSTPTDRAGNTTPAGDLKQHNSQWQGGVDGEEYARVFDRWASCARPPQVIMPTANSPAAKEVVTAALLVIGGKILSGRTKDRNIGYIAEYLTAVGIDLKEVRVVGDEERAIVDALNALRPRYTYVFTTGGIGPTQGDITADCVAKAFGVSIDTDPRALAILQEWVKTTGAGINEARLRMTRIPNGADLLLNKVSGAPGFWIGNVIVMAGVPSIMQAMLDEVAPKLKSGVRMLSEAVRADAREGDIGMQLGEIAKSRGCDRQLSVLRSAARAQHECGAARPRCTEARAGQTRGHAGANATSPIK
jgi:molybdopterin-biosynthesis enzyme MoeA-like protein